MARPVTQGPSVKFVAIPLPRVARERLDELVAATKSPKSGLVAWLIMLANEKAESPKEPGPEIENIGITLPEVARKKLTKLSNAWGMPASHVVRELILHATSTDLNGIPERDEPLTEGQRKEIRRRFKAGETLKILAMEFHRDESYISRVASAAAKK